VKIHIVKQGDSLYALSQKYGVPLQKVIEANPQISNPNVLAIGDKVKIPTAPVSVPENSDVYYKHTVKQGDTLWKLSKAWGIPLKDVVEANPQLKNPNVLVIGEVVNIPKKVSNSSPAQPGYTPSNASEKTQVGGKEYTGPKQEPVAEVVPAPKPAPIPTPKPESKPSPIIAPESNSAPHPSLNIAPITAPNPAPNPAPNQQMEIAPVQEVTPIEMQSLFVQITVPSQEPVEHHEAPKAEVKPVAHKEKKDSSCDNSVGYPGLGGNPYFYDSHQTSPNVNENSAPSYVQPAAYTPEGVSPYYFSGNIYSPDMSPNQWNPNVAPNWSPEQWNPNAAPNLSPEQWNPNAAPQWSPEQWSPNAAPNLSPEQWSPNAAPNLSPEQWSPNAAPNLSPEQWSPNAAPNLSPEQWNPNAAPNLSPEQWNPNAAPNLSPEQWNPNAAPNWSPEQWSPNAAPNLSPEQWNPNAAPNWSPEQWNPNAAPNWSPEQWNPNAAPNLSPDQWSPNAAPNLSPEQWNPNVPWSPCGCGGGRVQPFQTYSYEIPVYNTYAANPNPYSAYGTGTPNQGIIPSNQQYPGIGSYSHHNRVPEIQDPEPILQDRPVVDRAENEEILSKVSNKSAGTATKESLSRVKTSSQSSSKKNKTVTKSQRTTGSGRTESTKKRRNPWISN
jgi:morphogenetic protein associated with SpoVID